MRWLHFSDLHVGVSGQSWLWPRFDHLLMKDLEVTFKKAGGLDLIIFSGDLVQRGNIDEFAKFDDIIGRILDRIGTFGFRPKIITLPGNHDLSRPDGISSGAISMSQFWSRSDLREQFWGDPSNEYNDLIHKIFENYTNWQISAIASGVHVAPHAKGLLPGDASYIDAQTGAGIVCLNSTWLQIGAGDYKEKLHVDVRQILAVTNNHADNWVAQNPINILVSHHPVSWLHRESRGRWNNEINPPGRFDLHLFGHMHEPNTWSLAQGGGTPIRFVQAAALLGLETFGDGSEKRTQGYSANAIRVNDLDRTFTSWPRQLIEMPSGESKLVPDLSQNLDEETSSFSLQYQLARLARTAGNLTAITPPLTLDQARQNASAFNLSAIEYNVGTARAHRMARRVEQQRCLSALEDKRAVWVASDWGMGEDGFIAAICSQLKIDPANIYRLDFSDFTDRQSYFDNVRTRFGVGFEQIFEVVADIGPSIVILDDINIVIPNGDIASTIEMDVEQLVATVSDFAPEAYIFIRSRRSPRTAKYSSVNLKALDEADVATYIRDSEIGGDRYATPDAVSKLYRHTDGIPTRIDAALRDLEIISLEDLMSSNPDFNESGTNMTVAPQTLTSMVQALEQSDDRSEQRAYNLLLALSALPQGEQLTRLKRFLGPHPFHPSHARTLIERSLIDTVTLTAFEDMSDDTTSKALFVPRPVRDYIRDFIDEETAQSIDNKAVELYFGDAWAAGNIQNSQTGKRVRSPLCNGYEIQNAATLILRVARRALANGSAIDSEAAIRLAAAFIQSLTKGDHFRSAALFADDVIRLLEEREGFEKEINHLNYDLASSLRMSGKSSKAKEIFEKIDHSLLTKSQRQSAELGLAMCFETIGDASAAAEAAKRVISIDKNSFSSLQAKAILAEQIPDAEAREAELRKLLSRAQRDEATTLANNITLTLAKIKGHEPKQEAELLRQVIQNSKGKSDYYNSARALVKLASQAGAEHRLTEAERGQLMTAYHYLYNERLYDLFGRCHAALWKIFESNNETANLLNLFRHSSFIWRLNGREDEEAKYLSKLMAKVRDLLVSDMRYTSRDGAYFVVRVSIVLGVVVEGEIESNT